MAKNLFSIPIFFIVFRETLEAALIVAVLLGLVDQLVASAGTDKLSAPTDPAPANTPASASDDASSTSDSTRLRRLTTKLRRQIFLSSLLAFLITLAIGGAFIAVWFTKATNLWQKGENLWEAIFALIAAIIIFLVGISVLKIDRTQEKWRARLQRAFDGRNELDRGARTGKYVLFVLPFVTVLREGIEAVVFVGGVALGQPATAIPIAVLVGLVCGIIVGYLIYAFASRTSLSIFLIVMTNIVFLIGAGLFSRSVRLFLDYSFSKLLGTSVDDLGGTGPGSYDVRGYVWHLDCCNPASGHSWSVFGGLFGWTNSASVGSVLAYIFYWIAVVAALVLLKFREGRTRLLGRESKRGRELREARKAEIGS